MTNAKASKDSKIKKFIKAPYKVLLKARDFYMDSISSCAGRATYGVPMTYVSTLPKSFSTNSVRSTNSDEDFRELVKAASARGLSRKVELEVLRQQSPSKAGVIKGGVPRSQSVSIARIDEDKSCEFGADVDVKVGVVNYPRSRSYAVSQRSKTEML